MLAAFSDANLARISHATRFVSTAALVRIGLDHLSQKKKKRKTEKKNQKNRKKPKKNKLLIVAAQGGAEGLSH